MDKDLQYHPYLLNKPQDTNSSVPRRRQKIKQKNTQFNGYLLTRHHGNRIPDTSISLKIIKQKNYIKWYYSEGETRKHLVDQNKNKKPKKITQHDEINNYLQVG